MIRQTIGRLERTLNMEASLHHELKQELADKHLLNESLKKSEYLYRALFSMSPSANLIFDKETLQFLAVNKASTKIYNFSTEEFLAMTLADVYPSISVNELLIQSKHIRDFDEAPAPVITEHIRKDGSLINVDFLTADIDFEGRPARMIVVSDITKQISQVKAIQKQNEKLKEIAFMQSHVIRLPLTNIMALTDLIEKDHKETIDKDLLKSLTRSSNELDRMIRKIVSDSENILTEFNSISDDVPKYTS
jgi:PAS domain S-box-containing protein